MTTAKTVLVIEDEENLLEAVRYNLNADGYAVRALRDGAKGLEAAREIEPDLILLDLMLPTIDGYEVCRAIRTESDVPILMLTARSEEIDRVVGLELGADDYVTKPFSMRELMARVRALLRRPRSEGLSAGPGQRTNEILRCGDLEIDVTAHVARCDGETLPLKPREYDLLALFARNRGYAMTRSMMLDRLWAHDYIGDERTVDVHVRWLREKIEKDPSKPKRIITVRGVGYRFDG